MRLQRTATPCRTVVQCPSSWYYLPFPHYRCGTGNLWMSLQNCRVTLGLWSASSMTTESSLLDHVIPPSGRVYRDGWRCDGCDGERMMVECVKVEGVSDIGIGVWWLKMCVTCNFIPRLSPSPLSWLHTWLWIMYAVNNLEQEMAW